MVETFEEKAREIKAYPKGRRIRDVPVPAWLDALVEEALEVDPGECGLPHRTGRCGSGWSCRRRAGTAVWDSNWSARAWRPAVARSGIGALSGARSAAHLRVVVVATQRYAHLQANDDQTVLGALGAPDLPQAG